MLFVHTLLCFVGAGVFAGLIGWYARATLAESKAPPDVKPLPDAEKEALRTERDTLRGELEANARSLTELRAQQEEARRSAEVLAKEADACRAASVRSETATREMEALLAKHEQHICDLATDLAERDRVNRHLESDLAAQARRLRELDTWRVDLSEPTPGEDATLRDTLRRVEAERRAAEEAHSAAAQRLAELQRQHGAAESELKTLRAELAAAQTAAAQPHVARNDNVLRERDAAIASLQQQVRRLEPLAARYREAELRLGAVSRDRDAEVAGLRARVDEIEVRLREARDLEARLRARAAEESGESPKARARP